MRKQDRSYPSARRTFPISLVAHLAWPRFASLSLDDCTVLYCYGESCVAQHLKRQQTESLFGKQGPAALPWHPRCRSSSPSAEVETELSRDADASRAVRFVAALRKFLRFRGD